MWEANSHHHGTVVVVWRQQAKNSKEAGEETVGKSG